MLESSQLRCRTNTFRTSYTAAGATNELAASAIPAPAWLRQFTGPAITSIPANTSCKADSSSAHTSKCCAKANYIATTFIHESLLTQQTNSCTAHRLAVWHGLHLLQKGDLNHFEADGVRCNWKSVFSLHIGGSKLSLLQHTGPHPLLSPGLRCQHRLPPWP